MRNVGRWWDFLQYVAGATLFLLAGLALMWTGLRTAMPAGKTLLFLLGGMAFASIGAVSWLLLLFGNEPLIVESVGGLLRLGFWMGLSGVFTLLSGSFWFEWLTGRRGPRSAPWLVILVFSAISLGLLGITVDAARAAWRGLVRGWRGELPPADEPPDD